MSKCLICNIPNEIIDDFKYEYSYLSNNDLNIELKDLVLENKEEDEISFKYPFIYMFDYSEEEMNDISSYFKQKEIIPIYCASTKTNLLWTLKELFDELIKEHLTFQAVNSLQSLIKKAISLPINENKKEIENTLMEAFIVLQNKDLFQMNQMIKKLEQLIQENIKEEL